MNFKALIQTLAQMVGKDKPNYNTFKKALYDSIGLPASYNAATYADWKSKMAYVPEYAHDVLKTTSTTGTMHLGVGTLSKEIFDVKMLKRFIDETIPKDKRKEMIEALEEKSIKISNEIKTVFDSVAATFKRYEHAHETGDEALAIDMTTRGRGKKKKSCDPPDKVALNLMSLVKSNSSLSTIKTYLSANLLTIKDKTKAFNLLNNKGHMAVSRIIYTFETGSDTLVNSLIEKGFVGFNLEKARDAVRTNPGLLLGILKNPTAFANKHKIPKDKVVDITSGKGVGDKFMDLITEGNTLRDAFTAHKQDIKDLTEAFVKKATDTKKQPSKMMFFMELSKILRPFISEHYNKILNEIEAGSLSDKEFESISMAVGKRIEGQLSLAQDSFSDVSVKNLRQIKVPNCVDYPILSVSEITGIVTEQQEYLNKQNEKELQSRILDDTEKRLLASVQQIPPMLAQKLQSIFKVNIKTSVYNEVKKLLGTGRSLEKFNLNKEVSKIFTEEGGIYLSKLLELASNEVDDRNASQYSSTVHIRAILHLSNWSGKFRANNTWLYETIVKMKAILNKRSLACSSLELEELLTAPDIQDRVEEVSDPRNKKRDITRGHRKDPDYKEIDERKKEEKARKIRNLKSKLDIRADYSTKESSLINWKGEPVSRVSKMLWNEYIHLWNTSAPFRLMQSKMYVTPTKGFANWVTNGEQRSRIRVWRDNELQALEKSDGFRKDVNDIERMGFSDTFERMIPGLTFSAGTWNKKLNKFEPLPTRDAIAPPEDYWGSRSDKEGKGVKDQKKLSDERQSEVDYRTDNLKSIPVGLREKFEGYSLLGMLHRADNQEELDMVMNHIYDIVFTEDRGKGLKLSQGETFDPFKELSAIEEQFGLETTPDENMYSTRTTEVFTRRSKGFAYTPLIDASKNRQAEIQGLNNTSGATPA